MRLWRVLVIKENKFYCCALFLGMGLPLQSINISILLGTHNPRIPLHTSHPERNPTHFFYVLDSWVLQLCCYAQRAERCVLIGRGLRERATKGGASWHSRRSMRQCMKSRMKRWWLVLQGPREWKSQHHGERAQEISGCYFQTLGRFFFFFPACE